MSVSSTKNVNFRLKVAGPQNSAATHNIYRKTLIISPPPPLPPPAKKKNLPKISPPNLRPNILPIISPPEYKPMLGLLELAVLNVLRAVFLVF